MFFEKISQIPEIAQKCGCAIFVVPNNTEIDIKNAIVLEPEKTNISIGQIRETLELLNSKQNKDRYILIKPAELLGDEAGNALLKSLEEPKENYHFVLITNNLTQILPTIRSRSAIYFLKTVKSINSPVTAKDDIATYARQVVSGKTSEIIQIAEMLYKKKENSRTLALEILDAAVEILYKSYFKTGKEAFVKKIPKVIKAYENIQQNGNVRLHFIADLI